MRKNIQLFLLYITMPESIFQMWFWKNYYLLIQAGNSVFGIPWLRTIFILAFIGIQGKQGNEVDKNFYRIRPRIVKIGNRALVVKIMLSPASNGMMMPDKTAKYDCSRPLTKTFGYCCKQKKNKQYQVYDGQTDILVYRSASIRRTIEIRFKILEENHF